MKPIRIVFVLLFVVIANANLSYAQPTVRTFSPPEYDFELSAIEPAPPGIVAEVFYSGAGGGEDEEPWNPSGRVYWASRPPEFRTPIGTTLAACGYPENETPQAVLTLPSANIEQFSLEFPKIKLAGQAGTCRYFSYTFYWGMELGQYQIDLLHHYGTLTHRWTIDYPPYPIQYSRVEIRRRDGSEEPYVGTIFMGLQPSEKLIVRFYDTEEIGPDVWVGTFIAKREIVADRDGAAIMAFRVTRSAPFDAKRVTWLLDGYNIAQNLLNPIYAFGQLVKAKPCPGFLPPRLVKGDNGSVTPGPANNLRKKPEGTIIGKLPGETAFEVLDGPVCTGKGTWWQVKSYGDGKVGWTLEGDKTEYWLRPQRLRN